LRQAAKRGEVLIVAINDDESVWRLKGSDQPVINHINRAAMLAAPACVDHVVLFDQAIPHTLLRHLLLNVLVKGGTYHQSEVVRKEFVESYGEELCVVS
jgi:D-beta-D-heptose 7-phosphate kinase/D-beta-D-heptose 1-phosphate adenosyltransferase